MNDGQIQEILRDRNPWWRAPDSWADDDDTLREAAEAPFDIAPDVLADVTAPSLYVLLGPRRVGKSLALRRKIRDLIAAGAAHHRSIIYCSCDGLRPQDLRRMFKVGRQLTRAGESDTRWWFVDEITAVGEEWSAIVKDVRGDTPVRRDCVVLSGSSARGLRGAVDNLAGRRGPDAATSDRLLLPMGFRRFCEATDLGGPADIPVVRPADVFTRAGREALDELSFWVEDLTSAWEQYLRIGGYPRAVADFIRTGDVGAGFVRDLWDVVRGDAVRTAGLPDATVLALLERLGTNIASPVNASAVARDVGLANNHRVNDRIDDLTLNFLTYRCPQVIGGQPSEAAQRKVYFTDPLLARLAAAVDDQRSHPDSSKLTEQQVGLMLSRAIDRQHPGSFAWGTRLMYEKTSAGKEIDFVGPDLAGACFDGKYVDHNWKREALTAKARYDKAVLATRREHDLEDDTSWAVPAACLGWLIDSAD
ncbi:MAG TPA: AAA family ATPase [Baekduia sp.]